MNNKTIAVTGATGYLGSWIVKKLLERGFTVNGSVRSLQKKEKYQHLLEIEKECDGKLNLFEADLLKSDSFENGFENCDIVIHSASPFILDEKDPVKDLLEPALKGTENVLNSVNKYPSIKKVVLTSSIAAIYGDSLEIKESPTGKFDETNWNESSSLTHIPYSYSKVMAEKKAWEMHDAQSNWSLAVMNPGWIFGPSLTNSTVSGSVNILKQLTDGKLESGVPEFYLGAVSVENVAEAHILAALDDNFSGRCILNNQITSFLEIGNLAKKHFSSKVKTPKKELPKLLVWLFGPANGFTRKFVSKNVGYKIDFDNSRSKTKLRLKYSSIEDAIIEHIKQINNL